MSEVNSETSSEPVSTSSVEPVAPQKPFVSARKILANRSNALKSTGPGLTEAKPAAVEMRRSMDCWLERLCSHLRKDLEVAKEFTQLLAQLVDELKPVGVLQNWQVQRLAISLWMQSLVLRSQMAEFQKHNARSKLKLTSDFKSVDRVVLSRWEEMRSARDSKRRAGLDHGELTSAEMECIRNLHEIAAGVRRVSLRTETLSRL